MTIGESRTMVMKLAWDGRISKLPATFVEETAKAWPSKTVSFGEMILTFRNWSSIYFKSLSAPIYKNFSGGILSNRPERMALTSATVVSLGT